jgi:hypothetical protein
VTQARRAAGVSVAAAPWTATDDGTGPAGPVSEMPAAALAASTGSLKVTTTASSGDTPVAPSAGSRPATSGSVRSGAGAVVKLQLTGAARWFPARSAAPVVTVAR